MSEFIHPSRGWRWHKHNYMYLPSLWSGSFFLQWITVDPSPWWNFTPPMKQQCGETLGHLSLFTTFSRLRVISACHRLYVTQTCRVFVEQATWSSSFFLPWISAGREGWGYPSIFPISNGCHTSTWHTSELNNDHVLGNNTWTCGLRSILKHNAWGYISCHFKMTTQLHQPQKSKVNRSGGGGGGGVEMYILALFQYGCPRVFFCFPLGPKIKSGSISKEMMMHTQEVL